MFQPQDYYINGERERTSRTSMVVDPKKFQSDINTLVGHIEYPNCPLLYLV